MNLRIIYITIGILSTRLLAAQNQTMELTLEQVVNMARLESPDAQTARHSFRSSYWNYKYYRANYLPSLNLSSDPNLNRAINKITMGDGSVHKTSLGPEVLSFLKLLPSVWIYLANINIRGKLHP